MGLSESIWEDTKNHPHLVVLDFPKEIRTLWHINLILVMVFPCLGLFMIVNFTIHQMYQLYPILQTMIMIMNLVDQVSLFVVLFFMVQTGGNATFAYNIRYKQHTESYSRLT